MKKVARNIFLGLLILLIIGAIGISIFIGKAVFDGYTNVVSREETIKNSQEFKKDYDDLVKNYKLEKIEIEAQDLDHRVPAIFAKKPGNKNVAVLVHGMGGTKETIAPIMKTFLELGYDAIAYDQRNSGENMAAYNTSGLLESEDTRAVIDYICEKYQDGKLILWGESYGGLTSVIAAGNNSSNIDYLILESPVSNGFDMIENVMKDISKKQGIPLNYMIKTGDLYSKVKLGISFSDMDGREYMKNVDIPVLITHSKIDKVTPPYMAEDLYASKADDKKELITVDGYKHASYPYKDRHGYKRIVKDFLEKYYADKAD
ncbi:alpha/beta fold hydrolase [Finegoldia magna]|uniref:alpha/beta hydrolase n=1 Tax=Finegoldia magna TaxID=1260 RepID=UPI002805ADCA|nr:alpha/beta fold hydrolase [Finegoldia magna]MDU1399947.1 alpha/beta fold hydrolase [Finegoldia magna]MDU5976658.1 alpha/beta fold hydrolase [Finegoldia magna]